MLDIRKIDKPVTLDRRSRSGHKGDFGHVLVVGGSRGMAGAVALATNGALRGGAGLVTFAAPEPIQLTIAAMAMCATSVPLECDRAGGLSPASLRQVHDAMSRCDVLAIGPGMGTGAMPQQLVRWAIGQEKPVVIDADGLNNLAALGDWPSLRRCPLIMTPHPGEFSRLTGLGVAQIQAARAEHAIQAARRWIAGACECPLVVVLKGARTVVTDGQGVYENDTGNPGMASGGSGDVLTGLTAALVGQGLAPLDAAVLGVRVHGRAGDLAAGRLGEVSFIASDLLDYLPAALKEAIA